MVNVMKVTVCPPSPESEDLRFQPHQFDVRFGSTASKHNLGAEAVKNCIKDVTLEREIASILERVRGVLTEDDWQS